jgi:hypothetical protein
VLICDVPGILKAREKDKGAFYVETRIKHWQFLCILIYKFLSAICKYFPVNWFTFIWCLPYSKIKLTMAPRPRNRWLFTFFLRTEIVLCTPETPCNLYMHDPPFFL